MHTKPTAPNPPTRHLPRAIRTHECTDADKLLQIHAGPSGPGGAPVFYQITMPNIVDDRVLGSASVMLSFQHGPICEHGLNGITIESLLAVIIDRLHGFQEGPYPCEENKKAEACVALALGFLHDRTRRRQAEHAEGKSKPDQISPGEQLTRRYFTKSQLEEFIDGVLQRVDGLEEGQKHPTKGDDGPPVSLCTCRDVAIGSHAATVIVPTPEFMRGEFGCKTNKDAVSIDLCIVPEVRWLWSQGVITLGSCCGHGKRSATITVDESSIDRMFDLGYQPLDDHPMTFISRSIQNHRDEADG